MNMRRSTTAFAGGAVIGTLGGLIGLGGAEFRLPLLISVFRFAALEAVILNKAMSLIVVGTALLFRTRTISLETVASNWPIIINMLAGSLLGAWLGAGWATRLRTEAVYRVIAALLLGIAIVLVFEHNITETGSAPLSGWTLLVAAAVSGFVIGIVAAVMGVAGGELLIPTLVLLWGLDIKLAGSLSLTISLPTMIVGFARYSQDQSFAVLGRNRGFIVMMAIGSTVGTFIGGLLLGVVPTEVLLPLLAGILVVSAVKVWQHA